MVCALRLPRSCATHARTLLGAVGSRAFPRVLPDQTVRQNVARRGRRPRLVGERGGRSRGQQHAAQAGAAAALVGEEPSHGGRRLQQPGALRQGRVPERLPLQGGERGGVVPRGEDKGEEGAEGITAHGRLGHPF